jgi:RNA polymerase sigma-70 factor (ECF subfamily)
MAAKPSSPQVRLARSSEEWGKLLRRGDVEAVQKVRERVHKIVAYRGLGVPAHERDDIEQEIMVELWRSVNRPGFDFTAGFWGFVEVVAARRCIDWLRARRRMEPIADTIVDRNQSPIDAVLDAEHSEIAAKVLGLLDPVCRTILVMRIQGGFPYRDIAENLGKSEGAVRVQIHRCIRHAQRLVREMTRQPQSKT